MSSPPVTPRWGPSCLCLSPPSRNQQPHEWHAFHILQAAQPKLPGLTIRRHPPPFCWALLSFHFCPLSTKLRKEKSWQGGRRRGPMAGEKLCRRHGEKWWVWGVGE